MKRIINSGLITVLFLMISLPHSIGQITNLGIGSGTQGTNGTYIGSYAGQLSWLGQKNVFLGRLAGHSCETGEYNTALGSHAGEYQYEGNGNTLVGYEAGYNVWYGHNNLFMGRGAGYGQESGSNNVFLGYNSGYYCWYGSNNVFIGNHAGYSEQGSNKLYIANSSTSTPLIYGEFNNAQLTVYNKLGIGAKPNTTATLRIFKSELPNLVLESPGSKLEIGVATCNGCFAPTARTGDVVFRGLVGTQSLIFNMATMVRDSNKYIGFSSDLDHFIMKIRSDRKVDINGLLHASDLLVDGNIGIGTHTPQYKLDVCGTIRAEEIKIDLNCSVPDFVFKKDYPLMDLKELEIFVQTNHHLPEIPSEKEMLENGVNITELQMKLLQKIEELTLYTIQQEEKIRVLEERMGKLTNAL